MLSRLDFYLGWPHAWWWIALGALFLFVFGLLWWRLTVRDVSRRKAALLGALRAGAFVLLVLYLLEPYLRLHEESERTPRVAVWVDASRSMGYPASFGSRTTRYEAALDAAREVSKALGGKGVQVEMRAFGEKALDGKPPASDALLRGPTDLSAPIAASSGCRAVVLLTDGRHNASSDAEKEAERARKKGVGIYAVPVGRDLLNVSIRDVRVKRRVGLATILDIEAEVDVSLAQGAPRGSRADTELVLEDEDGNVLKRVPVEADPREGPEGRPVGARAYRMEVEVKRPGLRRFMLKALPLKGEVTESDNSAPFAVTVTKRPLKVLYMEGSEYRRPDRKLWEHQYLEQALEEDPDTEVTVLLRDEIPECRALGVGWVKHVENGYPRARRELFQYDVIVSSDIDIDYFSDEQLKWTVEFVAEHGGGFAMVGGWTAFGPGGYDNSVMDKMLPVDMLGRFEHYVENEEFHWELSSDAWNHPIMRIDTDPERNRVVWELMPPFFGHNRIERAKPAAVVLATHPTDRNIYGPAVILAVQEFGKGRSLALTTDTTAGWGEQFEDEWGEEGDNRYFRRFWRNVVKWLAAYRFTAPERHILISTDRAFYRTGETVKLSVEVRDENFAPGGAVKRVDVEAVKPSGESVGVPLVRLADGNYEGSFTATDAGEVSLAGEVLLNDGGAETDRLVLPVKEEDIESIDCVTDASFLERLAGTGNVYGIERIEDLASRITGLPEMVAAFSDIEFMHSWLVLACALGLLFGEWGLRKHWGLP